MGDLLTEPHDGHGAGDTCPACPHQPAVPDPMVEALSEAERIAAGRIKHGVGSSEDFPGNVCHLVSPIVGILRLRQHHGESVPTEDVEWWIDRLSLVLDMARAEAARAAAPDALKVWIEALADEFDAKGRRGSAHFGADIGDTIRLWIERDPRKAEDGAQ